MWISCEASSYYYGMADLKKGKEAIATLSEVSILVDSVTCKVCLLPTEHLSASYEAKCGAEQILSPERLYTDL